MPRKPFVDVYNEIILILIRSMFSCTLTVANMTFDIYKRNVRHIHRKFLRHKTNLQVKGDSLDDDAAPNECSEEILILNDLSSRKGFFITILKSPLLTSYNVQNNWH